MATAKISEILCAVEGCGIPSACRGYCNPHYQRWRKYGDPLRGSRPVGALPSDRCAVAGCNAPPRSTFAAYCEVHYGRLRRNGTLEKRPPTPLLVHSHGYLLVHAPDHPMATDGQSHAYQHRVVFFDAHGHGPHWCHVCGKEGMLADMDVDHLNEVKDDNRLENLRAACPKCNRERSRLTREETWIKKNVRPIEFNGVTLPQSVWAERIGISASALRFRLAKGWSIEKALTAPRGATGPKAKTDTPAPPRAARAGQAPRAQG